ncbi:hypothetical protein [Bradyrhizobium sp. USDA 3458]|uniref:hypothetical protein n=1 Tax=Bradyrhizobium sp. USDA 3458 TaxID=2591461 RepID=UPI001142F173|nr:hypothetical protein [Bradyrhizobium sp. USDA 3458]
MAAGWMVLIGHLDSGGLQNVTYAVAVPSATDAIEASLDFRDIRFELDARRCGLALASSALSEQHLSDLGIAEGEICPICDDNWQIWPPKLH